ncbi:MAG: lamin tail domain-containing protein [Planctomycetales bacterium]|nr:lamin tail domain-containing protein [Planctomycetales bacterium]
MSIGCHHTRGKFHPRLFAQGVASFRQVGFATWILLLGVSAVAAEPVDLFSNQVKLGDGFVRIACWNMQHLEVKEEARDWLPGDSLEEDYASLIGSFAQAIDDLDLHVVMVVEHQPRMGEPDRLEQLCEQLNTLHPSTNGGDPVWQVHQSHIQYDDPTDPFGNLQFGVLWQTTRARVHADGIALLEELRQPRDGENRLRNREQRAPWLVPITAGSLRLDLIALHLKSGGATPQAAEVGSLSDYLRRRLNSTSPTHLVVLGDWNIRPDDASGRSRLRRLQVPQGSSNLMRILTVEALAPSLDEWTALGEFRSDSPLAKLVPFTHFNENPQYLTIDNMLDHIAISHTLDETFDHPLQVRLADGRSDIRQGIEIARPMVPEADFVKVTDHLPVILTLRTTGAPTSPPIERRSPVRIVEAVPNPTGPDADLEEVTIHNFSRQAVSLAGWKIGDSTSGNFWELDPQQFHDPETLEPGQRATIRRRGRPMSLNNQDGDVIRLLDRDGAVIDIRVYDSATSGQRLQFD